MTIDWSGKLEAEHRDTGLIGHKVAVTGRGMDGVREVAIGYAGAGIWVGDDGLHSQWIIRNAVEAEPAPEHPTPTQYAPELVEALKAAGLQLAAAATALNLATHYRGEFSSPRLAVARALKAWADAVSDLPQEVDPDEAYAEQLLREQGWTGEPTIGASAVRTMIAQAHGAGRQLQRGEAA